MKKIGIVMGSDSDLPIVEKALQQYKNMELNVKCMFIQHTGRLSRLKNLRVQPEKKGLAC